MIFQFGLQAVPQTYEESAIPPAVTISPWLPWAAGAVVVFIIVYVILLIFRQRLRARTQVFEHKLYQVIVPRFRREEESKDQVRKEQIDEVIAAAETFFSAIGGLKAERGFSAWLHGRRDEFAFEIVAHHKSVKFYVSVPEKHASLFEQQISASYPDAHMEPIVDYNIFSPTGAILVSYMTFKRASVFPFKSYRKLDKDPLSGLTQVFAKVEETDGAAYQFIVRSAKPGWRRKGLSIARIMQQGVRFEDALRGRKKGRKGARFYLGMQKQEELDKPENQYRLSPQEEEIVKGLEEKTSKAGMDVCVRLVAASSNPARAQTLLGNMVNAFAQYNIYQFGNSFQKSVPRSKNKPVTEFIHRAFAEKYKIVVNTEEMASLWHLPTPWSETPNIAWLGSRSGPPPVNIPGPATGIIELGFNIYRGVKTPIWMKEADRQRHMYLIGKSGSGKSQLLAKMAVQDIKAGRGVAVVEPHGDLIEQILGHIPKERVDDVILFNPSDMARPMGLNMLEAKDPGMKDFAVQEMIAIFYKLFPPEMIGPMFEHTMRNVMLTLMADTENPGTLAEIPRILSDEEYAKTWIAKVTDPVVRAFWEKEMAKTNDFHKSEMLGYLVSKVGRFVENEMMRNIIGQSHSSFDFRQVMDEGKILLVNLSKGLTGDVNAELLGMIIVSKLQMAALGRANMEESKRRDFFLYIDEFQNFITDSIATILSEARKYRLDLIVAHQYIGQLVKNNDTKIRDAVFGNVGTTLTSRIGPEDVEMLEKIYSPNFSGYDLINSDKFTWYNKMIVDNAQVKPFTMSFSPIGSGNRELAEAIRELSRLKYGRDRAIVEADIMERAQLGVIQAPVATRPDTF
ncbi:type IV secretion system DNA-binding domain-containing protein [Candidatus Uhrbacteria bacterium]|nr:type IV secretion system DNA-binding domain-containing protein [Candidatus Uhrbacteria bacterium]